MSLARERACDDYLKNGCMRENAFLSVSFTPPRMTGDSAIVEALVTLVEGPAADAPAGSRASKGSKGFTLVRITLLRRAEQWTVSVMQPLSQS